jgi:REP element-mobilizing transposase RayT
MLEPGKDFEFFNPYAPVKATRANLPHWRQPKVLYFVTFRQADSIPAEKLRDWRIDYETWLLRNPKPWTTEQAEEYETEFARKIEHWLDAAHGSCQLRDPHCKEILRACISKFDGVRYRLDAITVAPNHAHALICAKLGYELSAILKAWKGTSARRINQQLGLSGSLWQKESYNHIIRNETALFRIRKYIDNHKS